MALILGHRIGRSVGRPEPIRSSFALISCCLPATAAAAAAETNAAFRLRARSDRVDRSDTIDTIATIAAEFPLYTRNEGNWAVKHELLRTIYYRRWVGDSVSRYAVIGMILLVGSMATHTLQCLWFIHLQWWDKLVILRNAFWDLLDVYIRSIHTMYSAYLLWYTIS